MLVATLKPIRLECYLPPTVWRFSVAVDINSNVFDFYFLIWILSRLLCCVGSGFRVAAALKTDGRADGRTDRTILTSAQQGCQRALK